MTLKERHTVSFLGVNVDTVDTKELCERTTTFAMSDKQHTVMYVNTDCRLLALKDKSYRKILNGADLVYADGIGVVWGARLWGHRLPGRSTGADFIPSFCELFARHGIKIYLLGGKEGGAKKAATRLIKKVPGLRIVGTQNGYFTPADNKQIIEDIRAASPHILLVGFGAPYQERWIEENAKNLQVPLVWGVGGLFDFLSGSTKRGPKLLLDNGFEWLCRLVVEPGRLWRRYLIGNTKFALYLIWHRFSHRGNL